MYQIITKDLFYYLKNDITEQPVYLCKINELNAFYINEIAKWEYEALERKEAFTKWEKTADSI